jgi:excisionase family DNA binding protein
MAQKYYNCKDAANVLGISEEDVKQMLDRKELHGYRDGASWKFKSEDIDQLAKQRAQDGASESPEDGDDVLLSEVALGQSDAGTSGTVIAMNWVDRGVTDSDIRLADSDIVLSDSSKTPIPTKPGDSASKSKKFEELDLALEEDLTLKGSSPALSGARGAAAPKPGSSIIDLTSDEPSVKAGSKSSGSSSDLVLGGIEGGSDITLGGDSGISLVDPSDSGLSLEQPVLNLAGTKGEESLELGEDDMLAPEAAPADLMSLKTDNEFLLSPLEESTDLQESSSESGSQVIALDTEGADGGMMGAGVEGMATMLDDDITSQPALGIATSSLGIPPSSLIEGAPLGQGTTVLPDAPYTWLQISGLAVCTVLLILCGMMMYDLLRNMWSWNEPYSVNSSLMDAILSLFEGK